MSDVRIFLSHAHQDLAFCMRLIEAIRQHIPTADIFFDHESLIGGDDWMTRIQREVVARPIFLVVISLASVEAEWVREETNLALRLAIKDSQRRTIPIIHQESDLDRLAPLLRNHQSVDCASQDEQFGFSQVMVALTGPTERRASALLDPAYEDARRRVVEVHDAYIARNWRDVVRLGRFAASLPGNERDTELWGELGIALIRLGQPSEGLQALDRALALNRFRVDLWRERARSLIYQLHQPDAAIAAWDMALAATATSLGRFDLYLEECEALSSVRRWRDALAFSVEAAKIETHDPRLWMARGDALRNLGRPTEAITDYDAALRLNPQATPALRGKVLAMVQAGAFAEALEVCDQLLALAPSDATGWSAKGRALAGKSSFTEAIQAVDRALALEPQNMLYLGEKAYYLIQTGQYGVALLLLDSSLVLAPSLGYLWALKAAALRGLRRYEEAQATELHARELDNRATV